MTFTFLITAAVLIILLIIPQIMKRVVYKKIDRISVRKRL